MLEPGTGPRPRRSSERSAASPFLTGWGERYQLGPGSIRVAHTSEEHILKADLLRGVELYARLAADLLAREAS